MRRLTFIQEVAISGGGASANCRRKVELLRGLDIQVRQISLATRAGGARGRIELMAGTLRALRAVIGSEIVYSRFMARALPLALSAALLRRRTVLEANGRILEDIDNPVVRRLAWCAVALLIRSKNTQVCGDVGHRDYYLRTWPKLRWTVLPLGVEQSEHVSSAPPPAPSEPVFLFAGHLAPMQGVDCLLEAFRTLLRELPNSSLRVFGDGPSEQALRESAADMPEVSFFGRVEPNRIRAEIHEAAVVVAPYPRSNLPEDCISALKVAELLQSAKVVVVPDRDSLVGDLGMKEEQGVFTWDGWKTEDLAHVMFEAWKAASGGAAPTFDRRNRVIELRGPDAQLEALKGILDLPAPWGK